MLHRPLPVTLEGLQSKSRQIEVAERCHCVKHLQPDTRRLLDRLEAPTELPFQQPPRIFVPAGTDRTLPILRNAYYAGKRLVNGDSMSRSPSVHPWSVAATGRIVHSERVASDSTPIRRIHNSAVVLFLPAKALVLRGHDVSRRCIGPRPSAIRASGGRT